MIDAYIFVGPTLPYFLIEERLGYKISENGELSLPTGFVVKFLPPVSEGDIFHLVPSKPKYIGIIDGYFETVPSVWHKEILYAMSKGIYVLGASSMGALRAVELKAFGMEGIGSIYQSFIDGTIEDDDEVTVAHGPKDLGFPLLSEAMVNIRRNLCDAKEAGVLDNTDYCELLSIAKNLYYKDRSYGKIISLAAKNGLNQDKLDNLAKWIKENRKDQKLDDAILLTKSIIDRADKEFELKKVLYDFKNTVTWNRSRTEFV